MELRKVLKVRFFLVGKIDYRSKDFEWFLNMGKMCWKGRRIGLVVMYRMDRKEKELIDYKFFFKVLKDVAEDKISLVWFDMGL